LAGPSRTHDCPGDGRVAQHPGDRHFGGRTPVKAVVFAMLASYFLSRTLVPMMVLYMLPKEVPLYTAEEQGRAPSAGGPIWRFHHRFNRLFERLRSAYQGLLGWALGHRFATLVVMLGFALGSLLLAPWLGEDFFPTVDAGQLRLHVRAPSGSRIEETERVFGRVEDVDGRRVGPGVMPYRAV